MENFIVSARKYRPATFDTVVGQVSITSTLKNAIRNKHMAQAFLFCGPRGVGKTTCARILAKTINCLNRTDNVEACDNCSSCISFNNSHSLNVFELDAASNNSVEDIRKLVDQVRFAPQLGTHKVYIIDEVHMLSNSAFNAFLKTLEEPPAHAIFILATTEKHKIIPTILSRCQIFDFNRIQIDDIVQHLQKIADSENLIAEVDGLHIIAQKADGGLRDALSMFDQIVTYTGNQITYKAVIENLNILDYDYYFRVTDAILKQNIADSLLLFNEILGHGFDGHNFLNGLAGHFRNLLVCTDPAMLQLLEVGVNIKENYNLQAQSCTPIFLLTGLNILNQADINYKSSKNQRLLVELALMQLCSVNGTSFLDAEKKNDFIKIIPPLGIEMSSSVATAISSSINKQNNTEKTKPEPKVIPVVSNPKPLGIGSLGKSKTISIHQITNKITSIETVGEGMGNYSVSKDSEKLKPFFQNDLNIFWNKFAEGINNQGKRNFYAVLTSRKPVLKDGFIVQISLDNEVQMEQMKSEQSELLGFLKSELFNTQIVLEVVLNEIKHERKLFTPQEKFQRMAEKNPFIVTLKQKFDLEFDF